MNSKRKIPSRYEILVGNTVCWRGNQPKQALRLLARKYPRATLSIRWKAWKEILIALQVV